MVKYRIILVDDHPALRAGVKFLLESDASCEVVGEATDGQQAIRLVEQVEADVLILDLSLPHMSGIECIRELKSRNCKIRIVVFTMHSDERYVKEAMQAGACAYVEKQAVDTELIAAVKAAAAGQIYLNPEKSQMLLASLLAAPHKPEEKDPYVILSSREREVLKLIVRGYSLGEIGENLSLSVKTVETYKSRLMQKLEYTKKSELIEYAVKYGLLPTMNT